MSMLSVDAAMPPQANILYQEACTLEYQHDTQGAIAKLVEAIKLAGDDAMLYTKLAGLYNDNDEYDKAVETYKKQLN